MSEHIITSGLDCLVLECPHMVITFSLAARVTSSDLICGAAKCGLPLAEPDIKVVLTEAEHSQYLEATMNALLESTMNQQGTGSLFVRCANASCGALRCRHAPPTLELMRLGCSRVHWVCTYRCHDRAH